jgi:hypothetical protein
LRQGLISEEELERAKPDWNGEFVTDSRWKRPIMTSENSHESCRGFNSLPSYLAV